MPISMNGKTIGSVFHGSTPIAEVWWSTLVWQNLPRVKLTGQSSFTSQAEFRSAVPDWASVVELPVRLDTSVAGSLRSVFEGCVALTSLKPLDTALVTELWATFKDCKKLTAIPEMDTRAVVNASTMINGCASLTEVDLSLPACTDAQYMAGNCTSLRSLILRDCGKISNVTSWIGNDKEPDLRSLTHVELHGLGPSLPNGHVLDLSKTALTADGATALFNSLGTVTSGRTVTLKLPDSALGASQRVARSKGWTVTPVVNEVVITGTSGTQARDSFRAALTSRGLDYKTVKTVPFLLDTSQVTDMYAMFSDCSSLTSVPDIDTSNVTNMSKMFYNCSSLTSVPQMDTSNVTNMYFMFNNCSALTSVPDIDTSKVTNMGYMFSGCSALTSVPDMNTSNVKTVSSMFKNCAALTDGNARCIGKKSGVTTTNMITNSGLTRLPFYDTNGNWTG